MADHVDANPSKGAGKTPRVHREKRRSFVVQKKKPTASTPTGPTASLKRKHKNRPNDLKRSKHSRRESVEENTSTGKRSLRKRKVEELDLSRTSDSEEEATTDSEEQVGSSSAGVADPPHKADPIDPRKTPKDHKKNKPSHSFKKSKGKSNQLDSSEETDQSSISSRLRVTPSRAAAASQRAAELATTNSSPKESKKKGRGSKKKRAEESAEGEEEPDEFLDLPGPSSTARAPYQLRSRGGDTSSAAGSSHSRDKGNKGGVLRSAHILSTKEKNLKKKGGPVPSTSTKENSRGSRGVPGNTGTLASNTGSCASSRCGRGGGPSSEGSGGQGSSTNKSGESGMSNQTNNPATQQSTGNTGSEETTTGGATSSSSLSAVAAASALSRGLAMLTGESDGDEGEMGRLQALLEARGLPPHLFGSLAPRMQQLLHRGMSSTTATKAGQLLQGLQAVGDEGQQLQAAIEMCQLLVMGNEDTLAGFPVKQTVPALIALLAMEHNFDMMNHACRALTYMMEALPRSTPIVVDAIPVFLEKLQVIQCMDVAEQSLTALEMLSRKHSKSILLAKGVSSCLTYLDFFSIVAQRAALAVTANCCQNVQADEFVLVGDSLQFLASRLTQQDKKSVESVCLAFSRLVDSYTNDQKRLEEIASQELLANLQQLLVVTPPVVSTGTFILVLRMLGLLCARCPAVAVKLLDQNIVGTLSSLLLGATSANTEVGAEEPTNAGIELVSRNPQELLEIVTLIAELFPKLPKDGIFIVNTMMTYPHLTCQDAIQWQWKDDREIWNSYSAFDSRIIEAAHQSGEDEISLSMQGRTYTIDFLGLQQINEDSGTSRNVQRKINPFYGGRSVAGGDGREKVGHDVRSAFLASHPEFGLAFLRPLFALLSEANSSSAGPAVRQGCVKTLLRIVHYLTPASLQKTLKPQQVANNLASMLGSSDLKIVVGAFQLCNLFMEKLYDFFVVHFRREGVFHQVSRISSSEVVGHSPIKSEIAVLLGMPPSAGPSSGTSIPIIVSSVPLPANPPVLPSVPSLQSGVVAPQSLPDSPIPFGLPVGGFGFVQQPGAVAANSTESLPQPTVSLPNIDTLNIPTSSFPNLASSVASAITRFRNERAGSSSSDSAATDINSLTSIPNNLKARSTVGSNSGGEKRLDDSSQPLCDPFKRKRLSKRPIPTSTTRRARQDDPNIISSVGAGTASACVPDFIGKGQPVPNQRISNVNDGSGNQTPPVVPPPAPTVAKRSSSKSSFFANLHPSRWTRGSGSSSSTSNASSNNNSPACGHLQDRSHGTAAGGPRASPSNAFLAVSYKEQVKSWLKEQSSIFSQKYCRSSGDTGPISGVSGIDGQGILPKLSEIISNLKKEGKMLDALKELKTIVVESDISSFEVNHSGLIGALLGFLVEKEGYEATRDNRLRSFIHVFADCPLEELSGEELDSCLAALNEKGPRVGNSGLSLLVSKLNSCFSQLEQFQVKVHEVPTTAGSSRVAPSSALRFFNTHQLKCVLQRHPSCTTLRQWKGGPVKIDPLALVQAIERYLIVRGFGRVRESRDSGDSEDENSDDDIDETLAAVVISQGSARHKLQFLIRDHVLPYNMTVYQSIRQFAGAATDPNNEIEADFDPSSSLFGSSGIWAQTHTIYYRPMPEEGAAASKPPPAKSSKKSKAPSIKPKSKSKKDPIWNEGKAPSLVPPYDSYLNSKLPENVTVTDPSLPVLTLLRVIHSVCRFWRSLYWPILPGEPLLPLSEFINTKVAAKAQRQLQDPVVIMTGNLPQWLQQIGVACPFLFPFETRQMLFYSITFDRDRALQRLLDAIPELNSSEREDRVTPRLDRRKRMISRDQILSQAEQLMQEFGSSRPLLEIQYENEVGTGLGPTLEFYALVSQELQKKELDLWHCESSVSNAIVDEEVDAKSKSYVHTSVGLFPKPVGKSVKANNLSKIKSKFKFMGRFMAKAVMDSRMIDLPLSKTHYKWILGFESSLSLADMADVDSTVARSIRQLVGVVSQKKRLELKSGKSGAELTEELEALTLDGCRIDNLGLDFTLPGHPSIELRKGGKDLPVTVHNLEDYIMLVCHWMLVGGISKQMDSWREGFDSVFPSNSLKMFYPDELDLLFCGSNQCGRESWDVKILMDCCKPDHGFTQESKAIQFLYEIMSAYNAQERRKFVQFVTGSPRLPVGGFKSLQPPLTIVRKTVDLPAEANSFLPSVMTCVNYLKLPDYSSKEIMAERLRLAADEGQMSFHLS